MGTNEDDESGQIEEINKYKNKSNSNSNSGERELGNQSLKSKCEIFFFLLAFTRWATPAVFGGSGRRGPSFAQAVW